MMEMKTCLPLYLLCILSFYFSPAEVLGQQTRTDSLYEKRKAANGYEEVLDATRDLFVHFIRIEPDSALKYAEEAIRLTSDEGDDIEYGQSIMDLTHALYRKRDFDSVRIVLRNAIPFYESTGQYSKVAASWRNLAAVGEKLQQPDSSLLYLENCLELLAEHPDSSILGQTYLSQGFAYRTKGYYELSTEALLKAHRIFEQLGDKQRLGYSTQNLGITLSQTDRTDQAIDYMLQSINYARESENLRAVGQSSNNLGLLYKRKGELEKAIRAHKSSIDIARKTYQPFVILNNYGNLGKLYMEKSDRDSAVICYDTVAVLGKKIESDFYISEALRKNALLAIRAGEVSKAEELFNRAQEYEIDFPDPQENIDALEDLSTIAEELGDYENALIYNRKANQIIDSVYLLKRDQQIEELSVIYETEKKDAAIALLEKNAELDATRKRALLAGMLLLALAALAVIYAILLRRRKERVIALQERELEVEKRKRLEQELEFKKKELTAKVLQLARKNEFLQSLRDEVSQLRSSIDDSVNATSRRISRMIKHDTEDDDEWEQFANEFSSVHKGFYERLKSKHGALSKTEMRLVTLLKMNLSSKDIASTLRISSEGVKKARYRLRKKLLVDSDIDLQSYILSL